MVEKVGRGSRSCWRSSLRPELLGSFIVGDYVPWLGWLTWISGVYAKANRVAKEFDDLLEEVVEEHINREKGASNKKDVRSDSEGQSDFVDVLLWIQRTNALGFSIDRTVIKALILVSITSMIPLHVLI